MNFLRTIDKKVDSQSWVNVDFQKFACREVLYGIEGRRKVDEDNSDK